MTLRWLFSGIPIAIFIGVVLIFAIGLQGDPSKVPSPLIGKSAPEFKLPPLEGSGLPGISNAELNAGQVTVVNVFASWCVPCRDEHPFLIELASLGKAKLIGINYKDKPDNALQFLQSLGNPFDAIGSDKTGRASVDWGVYGVPETFIVNASGKIILKHVGPITAASMNQEILPAIDAAKQNP